jgi:protein-disulfide isomerase
MAEDDMMGKNNLQRKTQKQPQATMKNNPAQKTQRLVGWTLVLLLLVSGLVILFVHTFSGPQPDKAVDSNEFQYGKHPVLGVKNAPIKIVEFADFKCPSCKLFDQTVLPQLKKDFIDTGVVELTLINYPIISPDADSRTAAMAGEAVFHQNPAEFWKFYEAVYAKQGDEKTNWATPEALVQIARQAQLKVDFAKLKKDIDDKTYAQDVKEDEAIADKLGVNSTPTIFINGKEASDDITFNYSSLKNEILQIKGGK